DPHPGGDRAAVRRTHRGGRGAAARGARRHTRRGPMSLVAAAALVAGAAARGRAVPAFNVITLEQAEAVVGGAADAGVGVLVQVSENAIGFRGGFAPLLAACRELAREATVPVGIHLDHLEDAELAAALVARAPELGVGALLLDLVTPPHD